MSRNRIATTFVAALAVATAAAPAASAEQRAMSPEQQYAYTCGHLGDDCGVANEAAESRKRARRACGTREKRIARRAGRKAERRYARRCGAARRSGGRR